MPSVIRVRLELTRGGMLLLLLDDGLWFGGGLVLGGLWLGALNRALGIAHLLLLGVLHVAGLMRGHLGGLGLVGGGGLSLSLA